MGQGTCSFVPEGGNDGKNACKFRRRLLASFIDSLILTTIGGVGYFLINGEYSIEWSNGWSWQLIYTLYLTITPVLWTGYVIGKRICKIKIKRFKDDGNVTLGNMVMREVVGLFVLSNITFGISVIVSIFMVLFREDKRAIHDFLGGTYVSHQ